MNLDLIGRIHGPYVHDRRVSMLSRHLGELIPTGAYVLDVGCGDGLLAKRLTEARPDIQIRGVDVLVRDNAHIEVSRFDGFHLPARDRSIDVVLFVDVLHHAEDRMALLREALRVTRQAVILKDHTRDGLLAGPTLTFMDYVGNARHGVALPYAYWSRREWDAAFNELNARVRIWKSSLSLYPPPASWLFDRSLHFIAVLER